MLCGSEKGLWKTFVDNWPWVVDKLWITGQLSTGSEGGLVFHSLSTGLSTGKSGLSTGLSTGYPQGSCQSLFQAAKQLLHLSVAFRKLLNLLNGIEDGGMVPPSEELADFREGGAGEFPHQDHGDLAG